MLKLAERLKVKYGNRTRTTLELCKKLSIYGLFGDDFSSTPIGTVQNDIFTSIWAVNLIPLLMLLFATNLLVGSTDYDQVWENPSDGKRT